MATAVTLDQIQIAYEKTVSHVNEKAYLALSSIVEMALTADAARNALQRVEATRQAGLEGAMAGYRDQLMKWSAQE